MDDYQNNNFSQGAEPNSPGQSAYPPQPAGQPGAQGGYQQAYQGQPTGAPNGNYYRQQPNPPYPGGPGNAPYNPYAQNPYAQQVPEEISMWKYLGMMWVMALPVVGLVLMIIWAFSNDGINRRNYAWAVLLNMVIALVLGVLLWGTVVAVIFQIMRMAPQYVY